MYNQYPYPYNIFNQEYISPNNLQQIRIQKNIEQRKKIVDMVKAISDFCEASRKLEPEFQQEALFACIAEIERQMEIDNLRNNQTRFQ